MEWSRWNYLSVTDIFGVDYFVFSKFVIQTADHVVDDSMGIIHFSKPASNLVKKKTYQNAQYFWPFVPEHI